MVAASTRRSPWNRCPFPPRSSPARRPLLDSERLDAYRVAVRLDELVTSVARRSVRGRAWLREQAEKASGSVVLNLAEAVGREGADRAQRLRISRGSALEVEAAMTLFAHRGLCPATARAEKLRSDQAEHLISGIVSVGVVDALEMIDVNRSDRIRSLQPQQRIIKRATR